LDRNQDRTTPEDLVIHWFLSDRTLQHGSVVGANMCYAGMLPQQF